MPAIGADLIAHRGHGPLLQGFSKTHRPLQKYADKSLER